MNPPTTPCGLCGRAFDRAGLTKHHCLPKSKGGTVEHVELICGMCHSMVHATFTNETLAAVYPTLAELRKAPELAKFVRWVRKQPSTRKTRNAPRKQKL
ncbi:MAG TPA: HNH endonuclease signature motif containing protein [Gemmataceae bacterium]|jgi:5-methylcytosine-specific restriction protein A|nr:HNH endonuclease signature motif containing protein [Gemmataceae bacterium]